MLTGEWDIKSNITTVDIVEFVVFSQTLSLPESSTFESLDFCIPVNGTGFQQMAIDFKTPK